MEGEAEIVADALFVDVRVVAVDPHAHGYDDVELQGRDGVVVADHDRQQFLLGVEQQVACAEGVGAYAGCGLRRGASHLVVELHEVEHVDVVVAVQVAGGEVVAPSPEPVSNEVVGGIHVVLVDGSAEVHVAHGETYADVEVADVAATGFECMAVAEAQSLSGPHAETVAAFVDIHLVFIVYIAMYDLVLVHHTVPRVVEGDGRQQSHQLGRCLRVGVEGDGEVGQRLFLQPYTQLLGLRHHTDLADAVFVGVDFVYLWQCIQHGYQRADVACEQVLAYNERLHMLPQGGGGLPVAVDQCTDVACYLVFL